MELEDSDIYQALLDNNLDSLKKLLREQDVNQRCRDGRSYLHVVVDHTPNMDLIREILAHIDISFRDENGETALNLAHMYTKIDIYQLILRKVGRLVMGKDLRAIEHLFLRGWDAWPVDVDKMMDVKMDIAKFFQQLPDLALKVETVHEMIQRNNLQALRQHLTHHQVAVACDRLGLPPLQKAAIFQRTSIVEFIIAEYPTTLTVIDHTGRTALHYAACIEDSSMYNFLVEAGADKHIQDLHGLSPEFYRKKPGVLILKEVQRRIRSLQKRPRINNCFSLIAMMSSKDTNTLPYSADNVRSPFLRYNTSPALSNTPAKRTSANRDLMAKWRTLVSIIPIHSHFKSSRKNQNNELFEDTNLYEAIIMNEKEEVHHLLGQSMNTNLRSLEGWSYLHLAVAHSAHKDIVRMLIDHVDMTLRDADGLTFIDLAVVSSAPNDIIEEVQRYILRWLKSGEVTLTKTLVLNGWATWPLDLYNEESASDLPKKSMDFLNSIPTMQETITSFHRYVMTCNMNKIRQQLTGSTSQLTQVDLLESCDQTGLPPLHKAVIFQCERAVQILLNTFINAVDICDNMERTALHYAACLEDDGLMYTTLIDVGAENNIPDLWGFTAMEYREMPHLINMDNIRDNILKMVATSSPSQSLVWPSCLLDSRMEDSKLYKAIQDDNKDEVENLLTAGEDANIRDKDGKSLLHVAASKFNKDIVKALLKWMTGTARDEKGDNFVSAVAAEGKTEEAKELRKLFLSHVLEEGNVEKAERMLMEGWDEWDDVTVDEAKEKSEELGDFFGRVQGNQAKIRSIHEAIRDGRLRDVRNQLDRKMLVRAADRTGMLPLQKAVVFQREDIVKFIVKEFKDAIDLKDHMDRTALHYAAGYTGSDAIYEELKAAGADDSIKDLSLKSPADYRENPSLLRLDNIRTRLLYIVGPVQPATSEETAPTETADPSSAATPPPSAGSSSERFRRSATPPKSAEKKPIRMYIATDIYEKKNVPPPSTVDGKYVAYNLGSALTMALAEIAERRPWDPIEYLAQWLYKYRQNLDHNKQQEALLNEIRSEEASLEQEEKERAVRREEKLRIQEEEAAKQKREEEEERKRKEQEELQRKAKEAAQLQKPQLPTVTEEGEEDSQNKERDEEGQTELHKLAAQQGADLMAVVNMGYSLADRDARNRTARDIAEEEGLTENVESLDSYVTNLLEQENMDALQQLLLDGYDKLSDVIDRVSTDGLPDIVTDFVKGLPDYKEKISHVFKSVHTGHKREVAQSMERKKLAMVKDAYGRSPLHIAILDQHTDIINYILSNFPSTVRCRDNWNRTPLHYAMAVSEDIADQLREKGADSEAKDIKKRTPSYYKDEKDEILALKDSLDSAESSQPEDADETEKGETTE